MYQLTTLENEDFTTLTETWNRCWQGYYYEMIFTEENLKIWISRGMIQLNHSIALKINGQIIGFTFLGQDGSDGWIGGTAIDPNYRGKKLFAPMVKAQVSLARALGLKHLYLEVLSRNFAQNVYRSVGFNYFRLLYIYRIKPGMLNLRYSHSHKDNFQRVESSIYFSARKNAKFVSSWQRRDHYLQRYSSLNAWLNTEGTSGMLYAGVNGGTLLDAWSAFDESAPELLFVLDQRNHGEFSLTNQPQDPITQTLSFAGIRPTDLQYEMFYTLN